MSIKDAEKRLLTCARVFASTGDATHLLTAAVDYGKAKIKGWRNRDKWKARKRLNETSSHG